MESSRQATSNYTFTQGTTQAGRIKARRNAHGTKTSNALAEAAVVFLDVSHSSILYCDRLYMAITCTDAHTDELHGGWLTVLDTDTS